MFTDRIAATKQLLHYLQDYRKKDAVVLAIPRGGVPMGHYLAMSLGLPLDIVLTKKIGYPSQKELAIGAVSMHSRLIDDRFDVDESYIEEETTRIRKDLQRKYTLYRGDKETVNLQGKHLIIIDDGIATGSTMLATVRLVKQENPASVIIAVPVCSQQARQKLKPEADHFISLLTPPDFRAVSLYYQEYAQVTDEEVVVLLHS